MKFLLLLPLISCGLFKMRPTHPDVKRFQLAGDWKNDRGGELFISCTGTFHLNDPHENPLGTRTTEVESDLKRISGSQLIVEGFLLNKFDDFSPPKKMGELYQMHLNEADWTIPKLSECP